MMHDTGEVDTVTNIIPERESMEFDVVVVGGSTIQFLGLTVSSSKTTPFAPNNLFSLWL